MITDIRIWSKQADTLGKKIHKEIQRTLNIASVTHVEAVKIYRLEGCSAEHAEYFAQTVVDQLTQNYTINTPVQNQATKKVEIARKAEVMNPEAATLFLAARRLHIHELVAATTSCEYHFYGSLTDEQLQLICSKLLMNGAIEQIINEQPSSLLLEDKPGIITTLALRSMNNQELARLSQERQLSLTLEELKTVQNY